VQEELLEWPALSSTACLHSVPVSPRLQLSVRREGDRAVSEFARSSVRGTGGVVPAKGRERPIEKGEASYGTGEFVHVRMDDEDAIENDDNGVCQGGDW